MHNLHTVTAGLLRADDIIAAYNTVNPILEFWNRVMMFNEFFV